MGMAILDFEALDSRPIFVQHDFWKPGSEVPQSAYLRMQAPSHSRIDGMTLTARTIILAMVVENLAEKARGRGLGG